MSTPITPARRSVWKIVLVVAAAVLVGLLAIPGAVSVVGDPETKATASPTPSGEVNYFRVVHHLREDPAGWGAVGGTGWKRPVDEVSLDGQDVGIHLMTTPTTEARADSTGRRNTSNTEVWNGPKATGRGPGGPSETQVPRASEVPATG